MTFKVTLQRAQRYNLRNKPVALSISKHCGLNLFERTLIKSVNTPCCEKLSLLIERTEPKIFGKSSVKLGDQLTFVLQHLTDPNVQCAAADLTRSLAFGIPKYKNGKLHYRDNETRMFGHDLSEIIIHFRHYHVNDDLRAHTSIPCTCLFAFHIFGNISTDEIDHTIYLNFIKEHYGLNVRYDYDTDADLTTSSESENYYEAYCRKNEKFLMLHTFDPQIGDIFDGRTKNKNSVHCKCEYCLTQNTRELFLIFSCRLNNMEKEYDSTL